MQNPKETVVETESRMAVTRGCGWGNWGDVAQRVQIVVRR